jgi:hypothetical protein
MTSPAENAEPKNEQRSWVDSRSLLVILFLATLLATATQFHDEPFGTGLESLALARNLAHHGEFANPFGFPSGPSAHSPPLFPAFLALLNWLFGDSVAFVAVASICAASVHAMQTVLLPGASKLLFADRRPGIFAALLVVPPVMCVFQPAWEGIYCASGLILFCLYSNRQIRRGGTLGLVLMGVAIGLLMLINPVSILFIVPWLFYLLRKAVGRARTRVCLLAAAGALIALLPWTVRNYSVFHSLFVVRDNMGLELYDSNNDIARPTVYGNMPYGLSYFHPGASQTENAAIRELGEFRYNQSRLHIALDWIRSHRGRFIALTLARVRFYWFPGPDSGVWHARAVCSITVVSVFGLALLAVRRRSLAVFATVVFAVYPLVYYLDNMDPRYRTPILWLSVLLAGYIVVACWDAAAAWWRRARSAG